MSKNRCQCGRDHFGSHAIWQERIENYNLMCKFCYGWGWCTTLNHTYKSQTNHHVFSDPQESLKICKICNGVGILPIPLRELF